MAFNEIVSWVAANWDVIGQTVLAVLGAASLIARLTPTEADNAIVDAVLKVVHGLGLTKPAASPAPPADPVE